MAFLGHIISKDGIQVGSSKLEVVRKWPRPTTVTEVRSFLGLASYYCCFVKDFSKIAAPLTPIDSKGSKESMDGFVRGKFCEVDGVLDHGFAHSFF